MEGKVSFKIPGVEKEGHTWYKVFRDLKSVKPGIFPLICLSGGPGACHEYLLPLADLYNKHHIPVVLYDQIGEGRSTQLPEKANDPGFWTGELFSAELDNLIDHLGLRSGFDLYGQSWGGMLASFYAARRPEGLRRLVLGNAPASTELLLSGINVLIQKLPADVRNAIEESRKTGDYDSDRYKQAVEVFYHANLCRLESWPKDLLDSLTHLEEGYVYKTMYGPSELDCTGPLKSWSTIEVASKINVPTLLINGEYDEVTNSSVQPFFDRIPRVEWVTIKNASHMCHLEKPEKFILVMSEFLLA